MAHPRSTGNFPHRAASTRRMRKDSQRRRMLLERLEDRSLLASLPLGAMPDDTGEYMLGDVLVSVVLMESNSSLSPFDASTENWTPGLIASVKSQIEEGLNWWSQSLDAMANVRDGL